MSATAWLYLATPDDLDDPVLLRHGEALLTAEELAHRDRYAFEQGRREFLLTRVLVRTSLSRHAPVAPQEWRFAIGEHGRPSILLPPVQLSFNLSNTDGLVACLVSPDAEVGVDVEAIDRLREIALIVDRYFSPSEAAALRAEPESRRRARFFDYWALKEAYLKARGLGLSIPLYDFSFDLSEGAPITVRFAPELADERSRWSFALLRPTPRHVVAVALRFDAEPPELQVVWTQPLRDVHPP
jgi:4'-phosphopantetheinyl transferase